VEPDELYDEGADDADEAWVDRHYRESTRDPSIDRLLASWFASLPVRD